MSQTAAVHSRLPQSNGRPATGTPPGGEDAARVLRQDGKRENRTAGYSAANLSLLVLDDDPHILQACSQIAAGIGFAVQTAGTAEEARRLVNTQAPDVILMDLKMPGGGLTLLEEIRSQRPRSSIVVMTAFATVTSAVEAMRIGTTDYLIKPFAMDELLTVLERAGRRRSHELEGQRVKGKLQKQPNGLIGSSPEMEKIARIVQRVAPATHPLLIMGESGAGKETIARAIHASGPNASKRFAVFECGQIAPSVLETELFGTAKTPPLNGGRSKPGALASEDGGTLLLKQISEMPLDLQARLARAIGDRQIKPGGSEQALPVTVRILAASTRNLSTLVDQGAFRKDLLYRLNIVSLRIPSLRERREDIPLLAEHFLERMRREKATMYQFAPDAMQVLTEYDWPGNVQELESSIERACALSSGPVLHMGDLPTQMQGVAFVQQASIGHVIRVDERDMSAREVIANTTRNGDIVSIADMEKEAILHTIRQLHGDKLMAAKMLGIGKTTLYRKLKEYGISDA